MSVWGWVLIGVVGFLLLGGAVVCAGAFWIGSNADKIQASKEPEATFTADELSELVSGNTAGAAKYSGKLVRISGRMDEVTGNIHGQTFLKFKTAKHNPIRCFFSTPSVLSHLKKGDTVTLQGYMTEPSLTVDLSPCVLVQP